jgi:hypothetical protein
MEGEDLNRDGKKVREGQRERQRERKNGSGRCEEMRGREWYIEGNSEGQKEDEGERDRKEVCEADSRLRSVSPACDYVRDNEVR